MQFIESLTDRTPLFAADVAVGALTGAFALRPGARAFPVTDPAGAVIGLVERETVLRALADGQSDRRISDLTLAEPLALPAACPVHEAIRLALAQPALPNAFVVMDGSLCLGVCSLHVLIQALLTHEAPTARPDSGEPPAAQDFQRLCQVVEGEFRAHAQGLMAMTDRLQRQHLGPDALAQVHGIRATGEALMRLAADAKDMLKAEQGRLALDLRPHPLRTLMDRIQDRWSARAYDAGVGLQISYDGDPDLAAIVDADRLTQVFDNLIDNALRYTRRGSVEAALRARVHAGQARLEGRVRDTGADADARKPCGTPLPGEGGDGLSLPLSLARGVLASMGGTICAETNAGQGVTILFDIVVDAADAPARVDERPESGAAHVLVVDDNATNRMVAEALCEMFDCTSETAEDGIEAVEAARSGRFDLILMDIRMPRMDGVDAARAIRSLEGPEAMTPIVALTANVDPEDARSYLAAGMCCVVEKPIKPDRLLQAINIALSETQALAGAGGAIAAA